MPRLALTRISHLYTCDDRDRVIDDAAIIVDGGRIEAVGKLDELQLGDAEIIELPGRVVFPGFVNTHHHFFQHLTRSVPFVHRTRVMDWLGGLYPLWAELDAEMMYWAALAASAELLLSGATTAADCSYLLPKDDGAIAAAEVEAVRKAGLRLHFHRGCIPVLEGDLADRLRPVMGSMLDRLIDDEVTMFRQMTDVIERYHDPAPHSMLRVALGPTAIPYKKLDIMSRIAELANDARCGLHTHFHSGPADWNGAGGRPLDALAAAGWIRPGTWFAHATRLDAEDVAILAGNGVGMAHCPRTIMRIGHGIAPIGLFQRSNLNWSIATDGAASNDASSMIGDIRTALLLHRVGARDGADEPADWMTPYDALKVATRGGAAVLGRSELGQITAGASADLTVFSLNTLSAAGAVSDPVGAVLLSGSQSADLTMVAGQIRVMDGGLVDLDEEEIVDGLNRASRTMLERASIRTGLRFDQPPSGSPLEVYAELALRRSAQSDLPQLLPR
jgi:cytosine/adenosine deaminase-related metal-dependent hydrolase